MLSIIHVPGDGGNDVSMIQAANVGLGIVGKVSFYLDDFLRAFCNQVLSLPPFLPLPFTSL